MTLDKLLYDIRESLKEYSDDTELDDRRLIHLYDIKRAKYIRQDINNSRRPIDISIKQQLCVELELVNSMECGVNVGCDKIIRSKYKIPNPLQLHDKTAITRIGSLDRLDKPFNFITRDKAVYVVNSTFPNSTYSFLHNDGHIYIFSKNDGYKNLECINIEGVFEHPLELSKFNNCCGCTTSQPCFDMLTSDYPIQPHYVDIIKNEIVMELSQLKQIPEDKINNADD